MRISKRWRAAVASTGMLVALGVTALAFLGFGALSNVGTSNVQDGIREVPDAGICVEGDQLDLAAPPDPACDACPKKIPGEPCSRVSCDPCCYRCTGEPVLRCY